MSQNRIILFFYSILFLTLVSCSKVPAPPPQITKLSQAQEHFLKICKEELKYDVYIIPTGQTMWVYVPTDGIFDYRASSKNQAPKAPTKENWSIAFLEVNFENKIFTLKYDIQLKNSYDKPVTYQSKFSDDISAKQREVLTALTRAYFDVGQRTINASLTVGHDQVQLSKPTLEKINETPLKLETDAAPPQFFVMVFADIKRGVAIKAINYFEDMRMALSNPPAISNDEYIKRYVSEIYGDEDMIGDKTGEKLKVEEITLGGFLAKQIENRIKYQFTQSGFPPTGATQDAIWNIVSETLRLYQFKDFEKIKLLDLQTEKESTYDKSQL